MTRSRLGLEALVLSGLVLGLMAFAASGAQAEVGANWRVNGANVNNVLLPPLKMELGNRTGSLSFTTKGGTGVLVLCTALSFDEGGRLTTNGTITLGRVLFTGCVTLLNEAAAPKCAPHSSGKPAGEILSQKITGLIVLDTLPGGEVTDLVKITPDTGKVLTVIELGESCAIGESVNVEINEAGQALWIKDGEGTKAFLEEKVRHLAEEGLNKLLAFGQPAALIGVAIVELAGVEHAGLKWSGKPG